MKLNSKLSVVTSLILGAAVLSLTACDQIGKTQQKIAYVNVGAVLEGSSIGKQEINRVQQVKDLLLKAGKDAEATYANMDAQQQQSSRTADGIALNRQWEIERSNARVQSIKQIANTVEAWRSNHNFTLVLDSSQVVAVDSKLDISKEIITQLENVTVDYGDLPTITVKDAGKESKEATPAKK